MFNSEFLAERREELKDMLCTFKYDYELDSDGSTGTIQATVQSREVSGNYITCTLLLPNSIMAAHQITAIHIYDGDGTEIGSFDTSITVNATQTLMIVIRVSYQEV